MSMGIAFPLLAHAIKNCVTIVLMRKFIYLLGLIFILPPAWGLSELTVQIGHQKQSYGKNRQSDIVTKNYYWGTSFYFFKAYTALDVYYAHQIQIDNGRDLGIQSEGSNLTIDSTLTRIKTQSYGIGIKQAFTGETSSIRPTISIGYARQIIQSSKSINLRNPTTNDIDKYSLLPEKYRYSSIFGTLAIQLRVRQGMFVQISAQTIFKAFEFDQFDDNLKYLIGLTWLL